MIKYFIVFLIVNFAGLALGGLFTSNGVNSEWYSSLSQAPWTPPGWVFGAAWTTIMICFAFFMAYAYKSAPNKSLLLTLFALQWILNFAWNPVFFKFHAVLVGLIVISALTCLVGYFLFSQFPKINFKALFVLPYFIWLLIATSLNAYIYIQN